MRILFICDSERIGGAGIAAARLAEAFAGLGHEIGMAAWHLQVGPPIGPWRRFRLGARQPVTWEQVPDVASEKEALAGLRSVLSAFRPHVVSVHNLHGGLKAGWSVDMVSLCAARTSTVWTLHDMWSFTGRCAYSGHCHNYRLACRADCPNPHEYPFFASGAIESEFNRKRRAARTPGLLAVCPSRWLARKAVQGCWKGKPPEVIRNPLDLNIFRPRDKRRARRVLGIPGHAPVVLAAADDFADPRKGADMLKSSLLTLPGGPVTLVTMGKNAPEMGSNSLHHLHMGFVADEEKKADLYSAADAFVHPAAQDNLPNTIAEALACGTPVVGFARGGVPEMVSGRDCGALSSERTPAGLGMALAKLFDRDLVQASRTARLAAVELFEPSRQAFTYLRLLGMD